MIPGGTKGILNKTSAVNVNVKNKCTKYKMEFPDIPSYLKFLMIRLSPEVIDWFRETHLKNSQYYIIVDEQASRHHYHVVFDSLVGVESVKKYLQGQCKASGLQVSKGKANAYYGGTKVVDDLEGALSYCLKDRQVPSTYLNEYKNYDLSGLRIKGFSQLQHVRRWAKVENLVYATDVSQNVVVVREKRYTMRERFIQYLHKEKEWQFYERNPTAEEVFKECYNFWEGAFTNPQGIVICRNAIYVFSDKDHQYRAYERIMEKVLHDI